MRKLKILLVEDNPIWQTRFTEEFRSYGHKVDLAPNKAKASTLIKSKIYDLAFIDLDLNGKLDGFAIVKNSKAKGIYPVVLSSFDSKEKIDKAYNAGALNYIHKNYDSNEIKMVFSKYFEFMNENIFSESLDKVFQTKDTNLKDQILNLSSLHLPDIPILISGQSGVGKTTIAKFLAECWLGKDAPFIAVNCSQFSDSLLESELFGHKVGAFTGATTDKVGLFGSVDGGVLFLDEIHALSSKAQQKILKVIEEKVFSPLGSFTPQKSKFRLITATNENLIELVKRDKFRLDLYARLNCYNLKIPALKDRPEDIELIFDFYLNQNSLKISVTEKAMNKLKKYEWPLNTREIKSQIDTWLIKGKTIIDKKDVLFNPLKSDISASNSQHYKLLKSIGIDAFLEQIEAELLREAFREGEGSKKHIANVFQRSQSSISYLLSKHAEKGNL